MFGMDFGEILVIIVIAVIFLGPEKDNGNMFMMNIIPIPIA